MNFGADSPDRQGSDAQPRRRDVVQRPARRRAAGREARDGIGEGVEYRRLLSQATGDSSADRLAALESSFLSNQVRRGQVDKVARRNDLCALPERGKMLLVACDEVVGAGGIGAFDKHVVIRVACHVKPTCRRDEMAAIPDQLQELKSKTFANGKLGAGKHVCIFFEDRRGKHTTGQAW